MSGHTHTVVVQCGDQHGSRWQPRPARRRPRRRGPSPLAVVAVAALAVIALAAAIAALATVLLVGGIGVAAFFAGREYLRIERDYRQAQTSVQVVASTTRPTRSLPAARRQVGR